VTDESSGKISYAKAVGAAIRTVRGACTSRSRASDEPCDDCADTIAALRALAALIEGCEQQVNPARTEPTGVTDLALLRSLAAGFDPHAEGGK
jgi:hypothetical protein